MYRTAEDLTLCFCDFPSDFTGMHHPDDYKPVSVPFIECILHSSERHHVRMIARICWQKSYAEFIPMSFVCNTGAPRGLYLSEQALTLLMSMGRITYDASGKAYAEIEGVGSMLAELTPPGHAPANMMGLSLLMRLGCRMDQDRFEFESAPPYW